MLRRTSWYLLGAATVCLPALLLAGDFSTEQWRAVEITLASAKHYPQPFYDVEVTATFTGPGGASLVRPAFWDGGTTWKIRFAPTQTGLWHYVTSANDPADAGLHSRSGNVICTPYTGALEIYRHGFLRVSDDHRHLAYRDGTSFFWLADTHWIWEQERLDAANKPGWTKQFQGMVEQRARQGFNVYQVELFRRWRKAQAGTLSLSHDEPNLAHFQTNIDPKWQYLADQGFVVATTLGILDAKVTPEQGAREARMARYVAARYGAYPATWLMYQECTANRTDQYGAGTNRTVYMDTVRGVGHAFQAADAYHQPRTAHSDAPLRTSYRGEDWLDFTLFQGGHDKTIQRAPYLTYYFDPHTTLPMVEGEADYELLFDGSRANQKQLLTADDMREKAYQAVQCGCCGYSYAANGVWQANWSAEQAGTQTVYGSTPWHQGIDLPGAQQMTHLKQFYTACDWPDLAPRREADGVISWTGPLAAEARPAVLMDAAARCVVVYFYRGAPCPGALAQLQQNAYTAQWFDPRTGLYTPLGAARPQAGQWPFPPKPDAQDWLLVLKAQAAPEHPANTNK